MIVDVSFHAIVNRLTAAFRSLVRFDCSILPGCWQSVFDVAQI